MSEESIDAVEFYWRPGCPFCMKLEQDLSRANVAVVKKNIWENKDYAAFVRSVADGNEVVPTIKVGEEARVNPSARQVKKLLKDVAPHLLK